MQLLTFACEPDLLRDKFAIAMHSVGDFSQVAIALGRYNRIFAGREFHADSGKFAGFDRQAKLFELWQQSLIERGHAIVVEA